MRFDDLDTIKASTDTKEKTLAYVMSKQKHHVHKKVAFVLCTVCILFLFASPFLFQQTPKTASKDTYSYITLDINPSMQWTVNKDNKIIKVSSFNDDANRILQQIDIKNKTVEDAFNIIFENERFRTYLKNGFLEVSVYSKDGSIANKLETDINKYLQDSLPNQKYHCSKIDTNTHNEANSHHISSGKYRIIEQILQYDDKLSEQELANLSMMDLYEKLESYDKDAVPESCRKMSNGKHGHHMGD